MPLLITREGGAENIIAWMATGAKRSTTSERKAILVNTSKEIAASSLGCVGDARAGVFGIKKEIATLTDVRLRVNVLCSRRTDPRTGEQCKHVW